MNSFISWIGGKRLLAKKIVSMMPEHHCYVEVFGGAGWVLFRKDPSKVEVWNDLNADLVSLFRVVKKHYFKFRRRQLYLLASREEYYRFMQDLKKGKFRDDVDRAIAFYYCIKNSFAGGIYTGWAFGPERGPTYNSSLENLKAARDRLKHVFIDNLSFERVIKNWDRKNTLFYCDPPYHMLLDKKGRSYYDCTFTKEDHDRLRDSLKEISGKFILSYDNHPRIRKLYKGFNIEKVKKVRYSMNNRPGSRIRQCNELLISNF